MGNIFRYYALLAKRWMWMLVVCALLCGGATYLISSFLRPVYQASAYLIINVGSSAHLSVTDSLQAVPTFAQLVTIPTVLGPVVADHPGMSVPDLISMVSVKPQTNTQIIELDVRAGGAQLAADLANQVSQSFAQYANAGSPGTVRVIPATVPALPEQPRPLQDTGAGALVGLVLALILVALFEWIGNRATSVEQIQELLGTEIMTLLPRFSRKVRRAGLRQVAAEKYHMICASLNVAQANRSFKLVMFTSALAGEGKSTVISNVAVHLARAGKQVLLVDLNIHRPALAQQFQLHSQVGLTNMLTRPGRHIQVERYLQATSFPGLYALAAGTQRMSSSEFLRCLTATQLLSWLKQTPFDYVLFDAPPLFAVSETRVLASAMEALVLVANGSRTPRQVLTRMRRVLWNTQARILGVIVNQSSWRDYADTHPYALAQPGQKDYESRLIVEEVTTEIPTVAMKLITASIPSSDPGEPRLPDTGETEQIGQPSSEPLIRPGLSLSGLTASRNGLLRRTFAVGAVSSTPPPWQDL